MIQFYLFNFRSIKRFGFFIPFKVYTKFNINFHKTSILYLKGRLTIGDKKIHQLALNRSSMILKSNAKVNIGKSVVVGSGVLLFVKDNAKLSIGDNTYFTSDCHIESVNSISIGNDCAISWGVTIIDDDHHQIIYNNEISNNQKSSVNIGNKVWIGCNVTILKNTTIGNNCVVAAGSVVRGKFPDNVLIGGNPARILKENVNWN